MEVDRTHRTTGTTSRELFICFTSRLSSSSSASAMKISKSILSPGRSRDPPISLSTSLSRRLRTNGSIKGGQASPMFPTGGGGGKKNRCAFENPEPSSPKVTCIGQVRVKSRKKQQGKKLRSLSRRHSTGEVSFRRLEQARDGFSQSQSQNQNQSMGPPSYLQQQPSNVSIQDSMPQRNQRWVHLPLTICEALRTFGSEFSCLFPCKSSCFSTTSEREKEERAAAAARSGEEGDAGQSSCGTVFRWLVAMQDGEGGGKGGGREIELVVGGVDDDVDNNNDREGRRRAEFMESRGVRNSRRHVFDDLEIVDNQIHGGGGGDQEAARVSICIPPKNALLLMRCRSDPVQMEALTNKFWESPAPPKENDIDEEVEEEEERVDDENEFKECEVEVKEEKDLVLGEVDEKIENLGVGEESNLGIEKESQEEMLEISGDVEEEMEDIVGDEIEDESMFLDCLFEEFGDEQAIESVEDLIQEEEAHAEQSVADNGEEAMVEELAAFEEEEELIEEEETQDRNFEDANEMLSCETSGLQEETGEDESKGRKSVSQMQEEEEVVKESDEMEVKTEKENRVAALPDCLLLMMCEPKLSMEVSKETWVCSTDFIRWQPQRKKPPIVNKPIDGGDDDESTIKKTTVVNNVDVKSIKSNSLPPMPVMTYRETSSMPPHQPRRSSCSLPPRSSCSLPGPAAAASMATMIEQKLVNAMGCEPFVLTRCKSEPMRNASKLVPETCFWKNRKLEPLRRAAYGVSAAGIGC